MTASSAPQKLRMSSIDPMVIRETVGQIGQLRPISTPVDHYHVGLRRHGGQFALVQMVEGVGAGSFHLCLARGDRPNTGTATSRICIDLSPVS